MIPYASSWVFVMLAWTPHENIQIEFKVNSDGSDLSCLAGWMSNIRAGSDLIDVMLCLCEDPRLKASLFMSPDAIALSGKSFSDSESAYEFLADA